MAIFQLLGNTTTVTTTIVAISPYDFWLFVAEVGVVLAIVGEGIASFLSGGRSSEQRLRTSSMRSC